MSEHRKKNVARFLFANGISLTTLITLAYYFGIFSEQNKEQTRGIVDLKVNVEQIQTTVQKVSLDVAILKTKVENIERR